MKKFVLFIATSLFFTSINCGDKKVYRGRPVIKATSARPSGVFSPVRTADRSNPDIESSISVKTTMTSRSNRIGICTAVGRKLSREVNSYEECATLAHATQAMCTACIAFLKKPGIRQIDNRVQRLYLISRLEKTSMIASELAQLTAAVAKNLAENI